MNLSLNHQTYDIAWYVIDGVYLLGFGIFEIWAYIDHKPDEDTQSAHVWKWIGTRAGWTGWHIPARIATLLLFLWLAEHFSFGWF
jgi:hypothetical protein